MSTKSKDDTDDFEGLLSDPFELFTEWNGEADSKACQAWSAPEPGMAAGSDPATVSEADRPTKQR